MPHPSLRVVLALSIAACGADDAGNVTAPPKASGSARVIKGPTGSGATFRVQGGPASAVDGQWAISPDQGRATLVQLSFIGAVQGTSSFANLSDCVLTYSRSAATLSELVTCPFEVDPGTYVGVSLAMSRTMSVLVNDTTNNIYSDPASPTLFSATAPSGGAQFVDYTAPAPQETLNFGYALPEPLVITSDDTVTLNVVADMTHTVYLQISGGAPRFEDAFGFVPVYLFATVAGVGSAAYYTSVGHTANYNRSTLLPPQGPKGESNLRVFYGTTGQPLYIFNDHFAGNAGGGTCHSSNSMGGAFAADPATAPPQNTQGDRAGGYLGKDGAGSICWAYGANTMYSSYDSYFTIAEAPNLADTTSLKCTKRNTVPAPTSGATYASGCPAMSTDIEAIVTLVAK